MSSPDQIAVSPDKHEASLDQGRHCEVQAGDRQRAALAHGRASGTEAAVAAHALNRMLAAASRQHQRGKPARSAHQDWLQPPRKVRILSHQSFRPRQVEFRHRF